MFDLSAMRPWEWARLAGDDARAWLEAVTLRRAINEGTASARSEKAGWDRLATLKPVDAG